MAKAADHTTLRATLDQLEAQLADTKPGDKGRDDLMRQVSDLRGEWRAAAVKAGARRGGVVAEG